MKNLYIKTFGCQINEYDSYIIFNLMKKYLNITETKNINNADIIILNTCSVRYKAEHKVLSELGKLKIIKKINKKLLICLGGCMASLNGDNIFKYIDYIDIIFGPSILNNLPNMISRVLKTKCRIINISLSHTKKFNHNFEISKNFSISSGITITEGCNKNCSYCVVPSSRGKEISRSFNDIISEIYMLSMQGVKEVVLLGQNVNSYSDLINNKKKLDLSLLINYINNINGIKRIKILSANPSDFGTLLLNSYVISNKLSNHLHLPLQSGSNNILKLMKRGYNIKNYKNIISKLKHIRPNISISTDIIVGFPGESDLDFLKTYNFIKEIGFDISFVYLYSPRSNTAIYHLRDNVSFDIKKKRLFILNNLLRKLSKNITESMLGSIQRVLIYKIDISGNLIGKTDNNRVVLIKINSNKKIIGKMLDVFIKDKDNFNLYGVII